MKQQDLTKLSKEELMERIKSQNAEDLKANTGCGTFFLIILVLNIFSFVGHNEIDWSNCIVPAFFVLWSMIEIWWKKRIDKCNGSEELVSMHKKYIKYRKTEFIVALVFGALFYKYIDVQLLSKVTVEAGGESVAKSVSYAGNALKIVENLGLILFVTAVGFIAGPNFFKNLKKNIKDVWVSFFDFVKEDN